MEENAFQDFFVPISKDGYKKMCEIVFDISTTEKKCENKKVNFINSDRTNFA